MSTIITAYPAVKEQIRRAFRNLKKVGVLAKINCEDCTSCASRYLGELAEFKNKNEDCNYVGIAYYHAQDDESFKVNGQVYIGFMSINAEIETETIGILVKQALEREHLAVEWQGEASQRIHVLGTTK